MRGLRRDGRGDDTFTSDRVHRDDQIAQLVSGEEVRSRFEKCEGSGSRGSLGGSKDVPPVHVGQGNLKQSSFQLVFTCAVCSPTP
jgi:hypothetical protein